ncbi:hypothetical protein E6C60_4057 [Paenibacillus algicola]|uniref:Uncharacterized protein n=1 Tax=Paenibacillus algicola TaxID=2565926 RepID=A0A4P8XPJ0_9BACL|nr:hypothetical protein [Paenibacillus algicola]QCT04762.1 hypothetical protein E6C60_4057 [Paenibacillus algicola]
MTVTSSTYNSAAGEFQFQFSKAVSSSDLSATIEYSADGTFDSPITLDYEQDGIISFTDESIVRIKLTEEAQSLLSSSPNSKFRIRLNNMTAAGLPVIMIPVDIYANPL